MESAFARQRHAFQKAYFLVQMYYACNVLLAALGFAKRGDILEQQTLEMLPLWPVAWTRLVESQAAVYAILVLNLICAILAMFRPGNRVFRALALLGLLELVALNNSFGKINHGYHAWLWAGFFLLFLPQAAPDEFAASRCKRQLFLSVFWGVQLALLLFYSMSGALKLAAATVQAAQGQVCALAPEALSRHVAHHMLITGSQTPLGRFFVRQPCVGWPLFLGALYIELFALVAAFRPSLHRFWGMGLIALHVSIGLTMGIWFNVNVLLAALLYVNSPFAPQDNSLRQVVSNLPLFRLLRKPLDTLHK
jgi:hypothetical protein